jgi:hypothetical protein
MWYLCVVVLALWLGAASALGATQPDKHPERRSETTADRKGQSELPARTEQSGHRRNGPALSFTPSEKVGAGQSVDFPADI